MDLIDISDEAYASDESPPDLNELESPDSLLKSGPIRERLLDIVIGLRTPTKVLAVADLADCDTETARDHLEWFNEMGMVHRHDGRPVHYERNDAYFQWRRINQVREEYTEQEIVDVLTDTLEEIEAYRTQFDAQHPEEVSLVDATREQDLYRIKENTRGFSRRMNPTTPSQPTVDYRAGYSTVLNPNIYNRHEYKCLYRRSEC